MLNLYRAALENQKRELQANVMGLSVAVMNALDAAFGGGQGKVLEHWLKAMDGPGESRKKGSQRRPLSPGTKAFFSGAPVVIKRD